MLYRYGDMEEWELEAALRDLIPIYRKGNSDISLVSFFDVPLNKKRFVKFQLLAGNWCFVDIVEG